ncbi:MAG: pyridoxamine kinase [Candidatus Cloacimonadia bacterium]
MRNLVPRVAAIHDLSGFGRSSLTVIIPILSNMGLQVCPLPTAVLSTHTAYDGFKLVDLTEHLEDFIAHWEELGVSFDVIYSGFLGSANQICIVERFIEKFRRPDQLIVVDPVMGDDGELYKSFTEEMIGEMRKLIKYADIITPNITEAAMLLNREYPEQMTNDEAKEWCIELAKMGPKTVVITSVPSEPNSKSTSVISFDSEHKRFWKVSCSYIPAVFPGTGDGFTSVLIGSLTQGFSLPIALDRAVNFISIGIRSTFGFPHSEKEGILIEKILDNLKAPITMSSYEIL